MRVAPIQCVSVLRRDLLVLGISSVLIERVSEGLFRWNFPPDFDFHKDIIAIFNGR